jgi:hypothetical protein
MQKNNKLSISYSSRGYNIELQSTSGYIDEDRMYCESCSEYYSEDSMNYISHQGYSVCENCLNEYYILCPDCNEYEDIDNSFYIEDIERHVCRSCSNDYSCCCGCSNLFENVTEVNGDIYCNDCLYDGFIPCKNCDEYVEINEAKNDLCPDCYEDETENLTYAEDTNEIPF